MADDDDLIEEYNDYSKYSLRNSHLDEEDQQLLKELNKLRYKFDRGYISAPKFFNEIDCSEFYSFLSDFEKNELQKIDDEKKKVKKIKEDEQLQKYRLKKEQQEEFNQFFKIISFILIIILILMGLMS